MGEPWKSLNYKTWSLDRPGQSLDKIIEIWSHFSNRSDLSDLHKEVAPEILPSDLGWDYPKSWWRSLFSERESVDIIEIVPSLDENIYIWLVKMLMISLPYVQVLAQTWIHVQGFWWFGQHGSSGHSKATGRALQVDNPFHHEYKVWILL